MNPLVNTISGRLSLRPPQREALARLARVVEVAPPAKAADPVAALEVIGSEFPSVTSFERDFPSLCFALATGVGKTRLMGAFIAYLHRERGIRHFLVLAPNLTIYDKLIRDFTPNTPKSRPRERPSGWCRAGRARSQWGVVGAVGARVVAGIRPFCYI